jgi:glucosylceramidase
MTPQDKVLLAKQAAMVSSSTSPFLLICVLAFAGVHINLWMVLAATAATFGILISSVLAIARMTSKKHMRALQDDTVHGVTSDMTQKHAQMPPMKWRAKEDSTPHITILPEHERQPILGFGGALTGSSCKVFDRMPAKERAGIMLELFHPQQMNLSVCRTSIGSSDYHPELYSYCDVPDPRKFSVDRDRAYVLPTLKLALKINPSMYLFSSPWSPPGWMKPNGTMLGGTMNNTHFDAYAQYFVRFLEAYANEGIPIQAVTVQNEVEADQGGRMPACTWTRQLESEFVAHHLGPALMMSDYSDTAIWMMDHNFDMEQRAIDTLSDKAVRRYCNAIAWHGYGGSAEGVGRVHAAVPNAEHHFTEFNTFIDAPDYLTNWTYWGTQIGEAMRNWCRDYVMWNVALDEHGKPNIGPFTCGGIVTIDSQTHAVTRSGGYWGLTHYSRFIRRGAHCIESSGSVAGLTHVAFANPDGTKVLVLSNAGEARTVTVEYAGTDKVFDVGIEADSVTTLVWY